MKKSSITFASGAPNPSDPKVCDIDAQELAGKIDLVHLIDVRRPDEFTGDLGHIAGSKLIVLDTIPDHVAEFPIDEPIVFVCRSGGRSANAASFASQKGCQQVFNVRGGMLQWNQLGLPVVR